jgi:hypothetical protein
VPLHITPPPPLSLAAGASSPLATATSPTALEATPLLPPTRRPEGLARIYSMVADRCWVGGCVGGDVDRRGVDAGVVRVQP